MSSFCSLKKCSFTKWHRVLAVTKEEGAGNFSNGFPTIIIKIAAMKEVVLSTVRSILMPPPHDHNTHGIKFKGVQLFYLGLTGITIGYLLPSLFPVKEICK